MQSKDIKRVTIAGAGTMGSQIALQCARKKFDVVLYDISEKRLAIAKQVMHHLWKALTKDKNADGAGEQQSIEEILTRIKFTTSMEEAADCDLINESVPEDPKLKGELFAKFNQLCPARTIFTTNTSTLLPSMFAEETGRSERLLALHFHKPLTKPAVVDVMAHEKTDKALVRIVAEFAESIDQIVIIPQKENSGYVFNHMLGAVLDAAMDLVIDGVASIEDVDRAWMGIMQMPQGPFAIMDHIGLDTVYKICQFWAEKENNALRQRRCEFVEKYCQIGHVGIKAGQGFYKYPQPSFQDENFVSKSVAVR
jgi:3-hydroxybutyryl-CoA dehydrogenase